MQPLDSEVLEIESVLRALKAKEGRHLNLEAFRKEAVGRFEEIGWKAEVSVWTTNTDAMAFDITLVDRCERKATDYDRMGWEIRNDILGVEPEKKGLIIPFSPEMVHSGSKHKH